ncbi:MAG: protein-disulfide reductase DsbD family protein [Alphaproteobacteria bacterium]
MLSPLMRRHVLAPIAATLVAMLAPASADAAVGPMSASQASHTQILSPVNATGDLETVPAGLRILLEDGWKTYWRSPGDAGIPPQMDWTGSTNVASVEVHWPAPHRFSTLGIETLGYKGEVVLPLEVKPERPGDPISLRGKVDLLVCSDICVPAAHQVRLDLPAGAAAPDADAGNLIARFDAQVPGDRSASELAVERVWADAAQKTLAVRVASVTVPLTEPDAFIEGGDWAFGKPDVVFEDGGQAAVLTLPIAAGPDPVTLPGKPLTVTVVDGGRAVEAPVTVSAEAPAVAGRMADLLPFLGVALLGGLVLNLMPCVLPVLSLKLMTVIRQQGQERRRVRLGFLATAAGALTAMLVLAGTLAAFKAAGGVVGWGMQFQQPVFIAAMVVILLAFTASMAGAFEVRLPSSVMTMLGGIGGNGLAGHVAMGAFATLLATPCSAPFLGTAVGFALARGPLEILAVFGALGVGLASPYLLVAAFPSAVRLLPRPGRWMGALRHLLALALAGTAVWLLTVLAAQTSVTVAGSIAAVAAVAITAMTLAMRGGRNLRLAAMPVAVAALAGTLAIPAFLGHRAMAAPDTAASSAQWRRFDQAEIGKLVAQGQTVFVDVTADWCVTCIVNKKMVVERQPVAGALSADGIVAMKADMTSPDAAIMTYLAQHGRYGIPFNVVYGPGAPHGVVLPEVLSEDAVLDALRRARSAG